MLTPLSGCWFCASVTRPVTVAACCAAASAGNRASAHAASVRGIARVMYISSVVGVMRERPVDCRRGEAMLGMTGHVREHVRTRYENGCVPPHNVREELASRDEQHKWQDEKSPGCGRGSWCL